MPGCATTPDGIGAMTIELWLAAVNAAGLLAYLVAALVRPERF